MDLPMTRALNNMPSSWSIEKYRKVDIWIKSNWPTTDLTYCPCIVQLIVDGIVVTDT